MKNKISALILLATITIPQVVSASWWNPFSWSIFNRTDTKTQILENRIQELEPKIQGTSTTTSTNKVETATLKKTTPTTQTSDTTDTKEWIKTIDEYIVAYQNSVKVLQDNSSKANQFKNNYLEKIGKMDFSSASLLLATTLNLTTNNQTMISSLNGKIEELQKARSEMVAKNTFNKTIWNSSKVQELMQFSAYITTSEDALVKDYLKNKKDIQDYLTLIVENLKNGQSSPSGISVQQDPYVKELSDYNQKLSGMKTQLTKQYEAAGGFWTASQLETNAILKLKEAGIKPPTSPYGNINSSVSNYTSIKCNSLNGGYDCYGSNGSRIQSVPIPGSGEFQINSW